MGIMPLVAMSLLISVWAESVLFGVLCVREKERERESCASCPLGPMEFSLGSRRPECHITFAGGRASERAKREEKSRPDTNPTSIPSLNSDGTDKLYTVLHQTHTSQRKAQNKRNMHGTGCLEIFFNSSSADFLYWPGEISCPLFAAS
jgi:hypothetical protein